MVDDYTCKRKIPETKGVFVKAHMGCVGEVGTSHDCRWCRRLKDKGQDRLKIKEFVSQRGGKNAK